MKKIFVFLVSACIVFQLTACRNANDRLSGEVFSSPDTDPKNGTAATETEAEAKTETEAETEPAIGKEPETDIHPQPETVHGTGTDPETETKESNPEPVPSPKEDPLSDKSEASVLDTPESAEESAVLSLTKLPEVAQYTDRLDDALKIRRFMLNDFEKRLYDQFLPYVLSYTPFTIDYKDMEYELESLQNALYAIQLDYPETFLYFHHGSDLDAKLLDDDGYYGRFVSYSATYFSLKYTEEAIDAFDKNLVSEYISRIDRACNAILEQMPEGLSVKEKYTWIANFVCRKTEYYVDLEEGNYIYADGPILYGKGMCQSYAYAYQWLCQKAGLWCNTCSGMAGRDGHCWNVVKLDDGKTYYMDLTWADSSGDANEHYFMSYAKCVKNRTVNQGEWIADGE